MWMFVMLALADPAQSVASDFQPNVSSCGTVEIPFRSKLLGGSAGDTTQGHVMLTSSEQLDRYKHQMSAAPAMSIIPAAGLPHPRRDTLSVLALVPGARNGPTGWTLGGQPVQVYIDGQRISTAHSFF